MNQNNFQAGFINNNQNELVGDNPNNNINPFIEIPEKKKNDVFSSIKNPSAKGLDNVGATCYMNATIQCLAHVRLLTKYLLNFQNTNEMDGNKYKLTKSYKEVLDNLWLNNNINNFVNHYTPNNFKNTISEMNPLFAGIQANDSKDLVLFMLETMHNELNEPKKNVQNNAGEIPNQYDFKTTFNIFRLYFTKNFNSIISNIFYGMYNSMMTCLNCKVTTHNVQCYNIFIFPLEEVRIFKNKAQNMVSIIECFEYYQKTEHMKGENQIYCNQCKTMADCYNLNKIVILPNVLVINLNRGKGLQFNVKIDFNEYLDLIDFVYYKEASPTFYELIGMVTHFGPSSMSGHFIAFCKSFIDGQWYKYNDTQVNISSFQEARSTGVPCILFYSSIKRKN
jgi:ubiquitin carboxyl-terminal hydrolase 8